MKLKKYFIILLSGMLLSACGEIEPELQDISFLSLDIESFNQNSQYKQDIAIGYEWLDHEPMYFTYDEYSQKSGAKLYFDNSGKLMHYMNFSQDSVADDNTVSSAPLSKDELLSKCRQILAGCVDDPDEYELSDSSLFLEYRGSEFIPCYSFFNKTIASDITDGVLIRLDSTGELIELQMGFSGLAGVNTEQYEEYFQTSLEAYIEEVKQQYSIKEYEVSRYFKRIDNYLCAVYTIEFTETDSAKFAEGIVLTREIQD